MKGFKGKKRKKDQKRSEAQPPCLQTQVSHCFAPQTAPNPSMAGSKKTPSQKNMSMILSLFLSCFVQISTFISRFFCPQTFQCFFQFFSKVFQVRTLADFKKKTFSILERKKKLRLKLLRFLPRLFSRRCSRSIVSQRCPTTCRRHEDMKT